MLCSPKRFCCCCFPVIGSLVMLIRPDRAAGSPLTLAPSLTGPQGCVTQKVRSRARVITIILRQVDLRLALLAFLTSDRDHGTRMQHQARVPLMNPKRLVTHLCPAPTTRSEWYRTESRQEAGMAWLDAEHMVIVLGSPRALETTGGCRDVTGPSPWSVALNLATLTANVSSTFHLRSCPQVPEHSNSGSGRSSAVQCWGRSASRLTISYSSTRVRCLSLVSFSFGVTQILKGLIGKLQSPVAWVGQVLLS